MTTTINSIRADLLPGELIVDSFAGGGGASLGIEMALGRSPDIAINHDAEALALHAANHTASTHYCENVWMVDPKKATQGRPVGLMWLSPDCKHFSKAKGAKPVSKKIRGLAWVAVRWAKAVKPRVIVLENVEEFQDWGPVSRETDRPCPKRKGKTFRAFVRGLERCRYKVEWRQLRACDYGAPTIRRRLFLIARRDGKPIVWPTPTHGQGRPLPWRTAAECIDWTIPCPSIFGRTKPLAANTMRRIARGIQKFVIDSPKPFIVGVGGRQGQSPERSVELPYQTITSKADSAVVTPYVIPVSHAGDERAHPLTDPFRTITGAHRGEHALIAPYLKPRYGEDPDPTRRGGLGQAPRSRSLELPAPTIVPTGNGGDLVAAFLAKHQSERHDNEVQSASLFDAAPTIKSRDSNALVTSHLLKLKGTSQDGQPVTEPLHTVQAGGNHYGEVRAFLSEYYSSGTSIGSSLLDPMHTVMSKDRFALVMVDGVEYAIVDIGMRMLAPRELYRAQGFPDTYKIDIEFEGKPLSKGAQVRMCGNSVCPPLAAAIVAANAPTVQVPSFGRERVA